MLVTIPYFCCSCIGQASMPCKLSLSGKKNWEKKGQAKKAQVKTVALSISTKSCFVYVSIVLVKHCRPNEYQ